MGAKQHNKLKGNTQMKEPGFPNVSSKTLEMLEVFLDIPEGTEMGFSNGESNLRASKMGSFRWDRGHVHPDI